MQELFRQQEPLLRAVEDLNRHQEFVRATFGHLEDMRRTASLIQTSQLGEKFTQMQDILASIEKQFRLPEIAESAKMLHEFTNSMAVQAAQATNMVERYWNRNSELLRVIESAMESISVPWLDTMNKVSSINGLLGLQGIGEALRVNPAFDSHLTGKLRIDLGDWRRQIIEPSQIFTDPLARNSFYVERGLNPNLTSFPNNAFRQIVTGAGLEEMVPVDDAYDFNPRRLEKPKEEAGFERTNKAHDLLQRFETQIRRFIDEQMRAACGINWNKHRIPGQMRTRWLEKQQTAINNGEQEWPLIAYADFMDYVQIITRKDNWEVFKDFFHRKDSVQESFRRLHPIRICTMHARLITQDDELFLLVETKRILAAIRS
ncbi:MAG: Swt1 family HEPN domain-containing protein [Gemmatimonadota bacterium]|nr:Swt1 family HEPN domain-containing protein [Gemmatimonadota bacterium]